MKNLLKKIWDGQQSQMLPAIAFLAAFFLCGAVVGCIAAKGIEGGTDGTLVTHVTGYLAMSRSGVPTGPIIGTAFFNVFKYHAAAFLAMFSMLGIVLVPAILAIRGFFLSFSITAFMLIFGLNGILLALCVFGISCLVTLPFLLLVSAQSFNTSFQFLSAAVGKRKSTAPILEKAHFFRFGLCAVILSACALFDALCTPFIVSSVASFIM